MLLVVEVLLVEQGCFPMCRVRQKLVWWWATCWYTPLQVDVDKIPLFLLSLYVSESLLNTLGFHFRLSMTASCPMLLHNYPLDKQVCRLAFESCKSNCFTIFTMSKAGYIFFGSTGRLEDSGLCGLLTRWSKAVDENMKNEKS